MKARNLFSLILLVLGITFIPKLDANANSGAQVADQISMLLMEG